MHTRENYFAMLGIKPTEDREIIKEAYKKAILTSHDDKIESVMSWIANSNDTAEEIARNQGISVEAAQEFISYQGLDRDTIREKMRQKFLLAQKAWDQLKDPLKLQRHYQEVKQENLASPPKYNFNFNNAQFRESAPNAIVAPDARIAVYVPMLIIYPQNSNYEHDSNTLSIPDILTNGNFLNPELAKIIVQRINNALFSNPNTLVGKSNLKSEVKHPHLIQVGIDDNEVGDIWSSSYKTILGQHSHYNKGFDGHLTIEILVKTINLGRASEKTLLGKDILSARPNPFLYLIPGTQLEFSDIVSIIRHHRKLEHLPYHISLRQHNKEESKSEVVGTLIQNYTHPKLSAPQAQQSSSPRDESKPATDLVPFNPGELVPTKAHTNKTITQSVTVNLSEEGELLDSQGQKLKLSLLMALNSFIDTRIHCLDTDTDNYFFSRYKDEIQSIHKIFNIDEKEKNQKKHAWQTQKQFLKFIELLQTDFLKGKISKQEVIEILKDTNKVIDAYVNSRDNIKKNANDAIKMSESLEAFANEAKLFEDKYAPKAYKSVVVKGCMFVGCILGTLIGLVAGLATGAALGGATGTIIPGLGNIIGAIGAGAPGAVIGAVKGMGVGAMVGAAVGALLVGGTVSYSEYKMYGSMFKHNQTREKFTDRLKTSLKNDLKAPKKQ